MAFKFKIAVNKQQMNEYRNEKDIEKDAVCPEHLKRWRIT